MVLFVRMFRDVLFLCPSLKFAFSLSKSIVEIPKRTLKGAATNLGFQSVLLSFR